MSIAFAAACLFAVAFVFCAIASASGFHSQVTGPCTAVSGIGLVASVVWLHLRAGDDPDE